MQFTRSSSPISLENTPIASVTLDYGTEQAWATVAETFPFLGTLRVHSTTDGHPENVKKIKNKGPRDAESR